MTPRDRQQELEESAIVAGFCFGALAVLIAVAALIQYLR